MKFSLNEKFKFSFQVVDILLKTGPSIPNVNLTNGDKETALHCAAQYGHLEVYMILEIITVMCLEFKLNMLI